MQKTRKTKRLVLRRETLLYLESVRGAESDTCTMSISCDLGCAQPVPTVDGSCNYSCVKSVNYDCQSGYAC